MSGELTAVNVGTHWVPQNSWGAGSVGDEHVTAALADRMMEHYRSLASKWTGGVQTATTIPPWVTSSPPMQCPPPQPKPSAWESEAQLAEMLMKFGINKEAAAEIAKRHAEMQFDIYRRAFEAGFDAGFTKGKEKDVEG